MRDQLAGLRLTEEQVELREWIHGFALNEMRPVAEEWDEREEFPWPLVERASELGVYGPDLFLEGLRDDPTGLTWAVVLEELFWGDGGLAMAITGTNLAMTGLMANGTSSQVDEWLPQCFSDGTRLAIGAFCASEPDAGSDVGAYRTTAVYNQASDEWVLNGTKAWATNGGIANVHIVVATVDPSLGARGHASFVIPPGTPGLSQGQKYKKHGIRASHTAEVVLDDVRLPGSCLLGEMDFLEERLAAAREGRRLPAQPAMKVFELTRPAVGAQAVGIARAAHEYAVEYAQQREQFGRPIIANQSIAFMLADMATEIEAARLLVWNATTRSRQGLAEGAEGSMAKLKAGRVATWVTERAIQILGGYGYTREYPVERWHRDAKVHEIFEGTEQIQQLIIARSLSNVRIS